MASLKINAISKDRVLTVINDFINASDKDLEDIHEGLLGSDDNAKWIAYLSNKSINSLLVKVKMLELYKIIMGM